MFKKYVLALSILYNIIGS